MRIFKPVISYNDNDVQWTAAIQQQGKKLVKIFFSVDRRYQDFIVDDLSTLVAGLLFAAMKHRENVQVDGGVSQQLFSNLSPVMRTTEKWRVGFSPINVSTDAKNIDTYQPQGVGCFFSGGVDSFYTLLKHNSGPKKITHIIFVLGFDISLRDKKFFSITQRHLKEIAYDQNVELLVVKTNLREYLDTLIDWDWSYGGALASVGLLLRKGFNTIYIASSNPPDNIFPNGSHPDIDPLWSTEKLLFVYDGAEHNRLEKIEQYIAASPLALQHLRVCYKNSLGQYNCNKCTKCMRTKVELAVTGALDKAKTLDNKLDYAAFRHAQVRGAGHRAHFEESLRRLQATGQLPGLAEILNTVLYRKNFSSLGWRLRDTVNRLDGKYTNHRLYKLFTRYGIIK